MKNIITTISAITLSFAASAINYKDLDSLGVDKKMQAALVNSLETFQAHKQSQQTKFGSFATVGAQNSCDYHLGASRIQDAIDANEVEIRIANDTDYFENLAIEDKSVTLKGGYVDCAAAAADNQTERTEIQGVAFADLPVIRILGNTQRNTINLDSLTLTAGTGTGFFPGGGISTIGADAQVNINNSLIANNVGEFGGGISIILGNTDFSLIDTIVFNNTAGFAGGVYCDGPEASFLMSGNSGVTLNTADGTSVVADSNGKGGGIFASTQCTISSFSGTAGGFLDLRGIAGNDATDQGGGIYAESGATIFLWGFEFCLFGGCIGDNTNPSNLTANRAESDEAGADTFRAGSGAFITGAETSMSIYSGLVTDNEVGTTFYDGGGIYADDGSSFTTARISAACWDQTRCNYYGNNSSGSGGGYGGAFYNRESTMNITNTIIEGNRADQGTVLFTTGLNAVTTIKASVIHHNGDNGADDFGDSGVFRVIADAKLDVHRSTVADNNATVAVFRIDATADEAASEILASIVHDASSGDVYDSNPGVVDNDCTIFHESASIPDALATSVVDDPEFVNRAANDYHINSNFSPAVDFCDGVPAPADYKDMDYEDYGFDDPNANDNLGVYDIGADESYSSDIIFKNGFE